MKTFERIPERVRAFQITQGHIDGSEVLPEAVALFFGSTDDALHYIGRWLVKESGHWEDMSDSDFHSQYREAPIPERAATTDQPTKGTDS